MNLVTIFEISLKTKRFSKPKETNDAELIVQLKQPSQTTSAHKKTNKKTDSTFYQREKRSIVAFSI